MKTKKLVTGALLIALGIILPSVVHFTGISEAGKVLLPMHLPVLLAGFFLGPVYGLTIGILLPIISFVTTGMPSLTPPILPIMIFELATYGLVSGLLYKKLHIHLYLTLFISMVLGRMVVSLVVFGLGQIAHLPFSAMAYVGITTVTGIPGIILQIILVPTIVMVLEKRGMLRDIAS